MRFWNNDVIDRAKEEKARMYIKLASYAPDDKLDRSDIEALMRILRHYGDELDSIKADHTIPRRKAKATTKEYAVHFKSNDGKEEHIGGHYSNRERAEESAAKHIRNGNKDVYIVERDVTEWKKI